MTRYRFDNSEKKQRKTRSEILIRAGIFVVMIGVLIFGLPQLIKKITRTPLLIGGQVLDTARQAALYAVPKSLLVKENDTLRQTIKEQSAQVLELQTLRTEYDALKEQVHYQEAHPHAYTARVIAKPSQSLMNSIILDQGSAEGIRVGHIVVAQNNLGIGSVVSTTDHTATVELFGGSQFSGDVHLLKQSLVVPAHGKGGGNIELEIPREITVTDGDLITFPTRQDVIIAVIKSVQFDPRDPFQTVLARAPVNVQTLRFVQVIE